MYRPSRLIVQDVEDAKKVIPNILVMNESMRGAASAAIDCIETELQEGEPVTGFEIIASLPIEEQQEIWCGNLPEPLDKVMQERWKKVSELAAVLFALRSLYTWNGTKWVEGQSAKNED